MKVVVRNRVTGVQYVLVGSGYGSWKSSRASVTGDLFPADDSGEHFNMAVCDRTGRIFWFQSTDLQVVSIDGMNVEDVFDELQQPGVTAI